MLPCSMAADILWALQVSLADGGGGAAPSAWRWRGRKRGHSAQSVGLTLEGRPQSQVCGLPRTRSEQHASNTHGIPVCTYLAFSTRSPPYQARHACPCCRTLVCTEGVRKGRLVTQHLNSWGHGSMNLGFMVSGEAPPSGVDTCADVRTPMRMDADTHTYTHAQ